MTLAGDSILVTPGSGATVATHTVSSKEHQVMMRADAAGHIIGTKPIFLLNIPEQVCVAAASTVHWDLFNADASAVIRVLSIKQRSSITTAVTGVAMNWVLSRTTAVGTGGSTLTPNPLDTSNTALDADVTARSKPTGGATAGTTLLNYSMHSEETNAGNYQIVTNLGVELVPWWATQDGSGIRLGQNQGVRVEQTTNSAAGNFGWVVVFTQE